MTWEKENGVVSVSAVGKLLDHKDNIIDFELAFSGSYVMGCFINIPNAMESDDRMSKVSDPGFESNFCASKRDLMR